MTIPFGLALILLTLGALVILSFAVLLCMLLYGWCDAWRAARTFQRWEKWGGPEAYAYFHDRISYRALKALTEAKREKPDDNRHQAMAVATAVHQYLSRTERPGSVIQDRT